MIRPLRLISTIIVRLGRLLAGLRPNPVAILELALVLSLALIGKGVWDVFPPAAYIVVGSLIFSLVLLRVLYLARPQRKRQ